MTNFKDLIPEKQHKEYIANRLGQLVLAGYQLQLDIETLTRIGDEENLKILKSQLAAMEIAIEVHKAELPDTI